MSRNLRTCASILAVSFLLASCGSNEAQENADNESIQSDTTSAEQDAAESAVGICPSADNAEEIVIYFSGPVGARDELDPSAFALTFTNALDEVVAFVEEDSESTPCTGYDEIYDLVKTWSDLTVEITSSGESVTPRDDELQEIADAGNTWLSAVEHDELNFSLNPLPEDIGR